MPVRSAPTPATPGPRPMRIRTRSLAFLLLALLALTLTTLLPPPIDRAVAADAKPDPARKEYQQKIAPLFAKYCFECHSGKKPKGGLALDVRKDDPGIDKDRTVWEKIAENLKSGEMPPRKRRSPPPPRSIASLPGSTTTCRSSIATRSRTPAGSRSDASTVPNTTTRSATSSRSTSSLRPTSPPTTSATASTTSATC